MKKTKLTVEINGEEYEIVPLKLHAGTLGLPPLEPAKEEVRKGYITLGWGNLILLDESYQLTESEAQAVSKSLESCMDFIMGARITSNIPATHLGAARTLIQQRKDING